jgi:hypothetical protein
VMPAFHKLNTAVTSYHRLARGIMNGQRSRNKAISREYRQYRVQAEFDKESLENQLVETKKEKCLAENFVKEILEIMGQAHGTKLIPEDLVAGKVTLDSVLLDKAVPLRMFTAVIRSLGVMPILISRLETLWGKHNVDGVVKIEAPEGFDIKTLLQREMVVRGREVKLDAKFQKVKAEEVALQVVRDKLETIGWASFEGVLSGVLHQQMQRMFNSVADDVHAALGKVQKDPMFESDAEVDGQVEKVDVTQEHEVEERVGLKVDAGSAPCLVQEEEENQSEDNISDQETDAFVFDEALTVGNVDDDLLKNEQFGRSQPVTKVEAWRKKAHNVIQYGAIRAGEQERLGDSGFKKLRAIVKLENKKLSLRCEAQQDHHAMARLFMKRVSGGLPLDWKVIAKDENLCLKCFGRQHNAYSCKIGRRCDNCFHFHKSGWMKEGGGLPEHVVTKKCCPCFVKWMQGEKFFQATKKRRKQIVV